MTEDITNKLWYCTECGLYWSEFYPLNVEKPNQESIFMPRVPTRKCKHCHG